MSDSNDNLQNNIGSRLKLVRTKAGKTQQQMADELHVAQSSISAYEQDVNRPTNLFILAASLLYDVDFEWLKDGVGEMKPPPKPEKGGPWTVEMEGGYWTFTAEVREKYPFFKNLVQQVNMDAARDFSQKSVIDKAINLLKNEMIDLDEEKKKNTRNTA